MTVDDLDPETERKLAAFADLLRGTRRAPVSRASLRNVEDVHIADSLSGLEFDELRGAGRIGDLGSGAGLPGLVLAAALPEAQVDAIESSSRKCRFIREAILLLELQNTKVICERSEEWAAGEGRDAYDAITARAVGSLATLAELASPLLREGGALLAWKGERDGSEEAQLDRAASRVGMEPVEVRPVSPYPGSRGRHIHLLRKNGPTPERLPRRNGLAAKRPFGSE